MHAVDASPDADVRQWNLKGGEAGRSSALPRSQYALPQSSPDLPSQVAAFTKLASAIASAPEPLLRGGIAARIFRDAAPGVVLVIVNNGLGSGIILNRAGQILTNWHVVRGPKILE
jgi:S1-C subfamily serine protease